MSDLSKALTKKIGQTADYFGGKRRVDNAKNPGSAYSLMKRKQRNTLPRSQQPKAS